MKQVQSTDQVIRHVMHIIVNHARGMWRYRWLAMGLAWILCAVGWSAVYTMPDVYEARAKVYVDTDSLLKPLLKGIAVSSNVMNEVTVVTREMLSRPNLAQVARDTDLDLSVQDEPGFDRLLSSLQRRIRISGGRDRVYTISFEHSDRRKAETVVQSLVDTFVEQSLGQDRTDSQQAQEFLQQEIAEYEQRLTEAEDRLARFKRENVASMPDQRGDYFDKLQDAQGQLEETRRRLRIAEGRKTELERQIAGEVPIFDGGSPDSEDTSFAATKIRELEEELQELRLRYTDRHPRIGQILETLETLRQQYRAEQLQAGSADGPGASTNPQDLNPVYQNMRIQLSNIEVEIASLRAKLREEQQEVDTLRRQVDTIPQVEAELNRLNRDYGIVKSKYEQLVQQLETANIGERMSQSFDGVQFRVIDPPFAEAEPVGPNRPLFLSAVLVMALGAGSVLAFLLNQLNPVFIGKRSVTEITGLPVLASVSLLQSDRQIAANRMNTRLLVTGFLALIAAYAVITLGADSASQVLRTAIASFS